MLISGAVKGSSKGFSGKDCPVLNENNVEEHTKCMNKNPQLTIWGIFLIVGSLFIISGFLMSRLTYRTRVSDFWS